MLHHDDPPAGQVLLSRRKVLLSGAIILASGLVTSSLPAFALPGTQPAFSAFMQISRLLVNHQLDESMGQRMLPILAAEEPQLTEQIQQLIAIAQTHQANVVEDFFPAIPEGALQALAYKIIFGWYTGSLQPTRTAKTFAFEQAMTWHTTLDAITIPSYGFSGPNNWQRSNTPVLPVPQF
ncbi:sugar dehydrogenase complex small subunit [Pantoea sp. A4]|uniref:sugar dehydrogenase complex small subunit n=1 Tax=Pantoea sp. A4 TaxID=1225184 RepID=UPI00036D9936|nr:sugar dehydrogenase complex small subunit [Pantoea sp. A4]